MSDNIELGHTFTSTVTKKYKKNGIFGLNDEKINHMPIAYPSLYAPPLSILQGTADVYSI